MRRTNRLRAGGPVGRGLAMAAAPGLVAVASAVVPAHALPTAHGPLGYTRTAAHAPTAAHALRPASPGAPSRVTAALVLSPSHVVPGDAVTARTSACAPGATAAGNATAVAGGHFTLARAANGDGVSGRFRVPPSAQPGTYEIVASCAGSDTRAVGDLVVALTTGTAPAAGSAGSPQGSVGTGVGDARGTDPVRTTAGVAALAVAAAGGIWLLYRRARGDGM